MKKEELNKYIPIAIIILLIIFSLYIVKDIFVALISAFVLAFLMRPVFLFLEERTNKSLAAMLSVFLAILIVVAPLGIVITSAFTQLSQTVNSSTIDSLLDKINNLPFLENFDIFIGDITQNIISFLISFVKQATSYLPIFALYLIILIFGTYYFLIDWEKITDKLKKYVPVSDKKTFSKEISNATRNIMYGTFLIALIELIFAGLVFWAIGINQALVLATLIAIFAFIPGLGPLIVWIPLALYLVVQQSYFNAIIVTITGLILSVYIDGILRAKVSGRKSNIHPFLMLIGIIGGIAVFGIFGFIIGPIILVTTIKMLDEITRDK